MFLTKLSSYYSISEKNSTYALDKYWKYIPQFFILSCIRRHFCLISITQKNSSRSNPSRTIQKRQKKIPWLVLNAWNLLLWTLSQILSLSGFKLLFWIAVCLIKICLLEIHRHDSTFAAWRSQKVFLTAFKKENHCKHFRVQNHLPLTP